MKRFTSSFPSLILFLFLFLCIANLHAQSNRFIYEYKFKPTRDSKSFTTETYILDIHGKTAQFFDQQAIEAEKNNNKYKLTVLGYVKDPVKIKRIAGSSANQNYYFTGDINYYKFETNDKINWHIKSVVQKKGRWNAQLATAQYGGRLWEAWFTKEIAIPEGPYKFTGLPGLIIELKDSEDTFIFELIEIQKLNSPNDNFVDGIFYKKPLEISFAQFKKLRTQQYNDPFADSKKFIGTGEWRDSNGNDINTMADFNRLEREARQRLKKTNWIERDVMAEIYK